MKKCVWILLLVFSFSFVSVQVCFAKEKEIKKPKQHHGFFFGNPPFWSSYFGSEDINPSLIGSTAIGYSLYGGFIDMDHLSEAFRWTTYYENKIYKKILNGESEFDLDMYTPSLFYIQIKYPDNWNLLSADEKEKIARDVSIDLAQYTAFTWTIYHEMLTWYGYQSSHVSEFCSAFSPEDLYSDLLGTDVSKKVLRREKSVNFETASLDELKSRLTELGIQPRKTVGKAIEETKKQEWWNGGTYPFNEVYTRNFDIGLSGFLTPMLIKGIDDNAKPISLPVPRIPSEYGFAIRVVIEPKEKQGMQFLKSAKAADEKKVIEPAVDFNSIMDEIEKDAVEKLKY